MLELFLDGAVLLEALQVDPAEQEAEHDPVLVQHSSGHSAVAGLEEAVGDDAQTPGVVGHFAQVWKFQIKFCYLVAGSLDPKFLQIATVPSPHYMRFDYKLLPW